MLQLGTRIGVDLTGWRRDLYVLLDRLSGIELLRSVPICHRLAGLVRRREGEAGSVTTVASLQFVRYVLQHRGGTAAERAEERHRWT
jgi:hypothetical protein